MTKLLTATALVLSGLAALSGAATASAVVIASVPNDTPIAIAGGTIAWSKLDQGSYRLQIASPGPSGMYVTEQADVPAARRPFDVSGTVTVDDRIIFLYTRCNVSYSEPGLSHGVPRQDEAGCDIYRYDATNRTEKLLDSVSSPTADEAWPVMDVRGRGGKGSATIAFVRRHSVNNKYLGSMRPCDVPYVADLSHPGSVRRLDRGPCAYTHGMAISRTARSFKLVQATDDQLRRVPLSGRPGSTLARKQILGEYALRYVWYGSPSITSTAVWATRWYGSSLEGVAKFSGAGKHRKHTLIKAPGRALRYVRQDGGVNLKLTAQKGRAYSNCIAKAPCSLELVTGTPESALLP